MIKLCLAKAGAVYDSGRMTDDKPIIGLWTQDPLRVRVLRDALALYGYGVENLERSDAACAVVVADDDAPGAKRRAWAERGAAVIGLGPGAIRLGALLARIGAQRDKGARAATGTLSFGGFRLDLALLSLTDTRTGTAVNLTEKERDILARLHREAGGTLDRRTLLEDVWGYAADVETHTLETHIYRLRQKLEADPANPLVLLTEEAGYRLVVEG
jgi:DNA-binding winged helix-turn-helix (wHTH) protein